MHYYGRGIQDMSSRPELKLEPNACRVRVYSLAEAGPVLQKIEDLMRVLSYPFEDILATKVALFEAVANAIRHGNRFDPSKHAEVRYLVTPDELMVEVEDQGAGFDPAQVPDPFAGGHVDRLKRLGLFLMRSYMNWVRFNPQGNQVTLGRSRSAL